MDTTIYRAVRLAYRLGRQDQQRILEHRLRKDLGADAQAKQIAELAAGMTDELVNFQAIILAAEKDSTEFNSLPDDATEVGLVNGPRRWTEDALREWHTQNCPRISEREASCFACSLFELLSQARKRHVRYLEKIRAAIGDDRLRRDTGEPETSDANEIRRLIAERDRLRGTVEAVRLSCRNMRRNANLDDAPEVEDALSEIETQTEEA